MLVDPPNDYRCRRVAVSCAPGGTYPPAPFNPTCDAPEFARMPYAIRTTGDGQTQGVYESVRECFQLLGLDHEHRGQPAWNPLRSLVSKGQRVVIKPNLVYHSHPLGHPGILCTITHASVIRPIVDYVLLATEGSASISICDVPVQSAVWEVLVAEGGYSDLVTFYASLGISVALLDCRRDIAVMNRDGVMVGRRLAVGDPMGYVAVDLGTQSALMPIIQHFRRLRITDYPAGTVPQHHNAVHNEYLIAGSVLHADLLINVAKMKTHRKTGVTGTLKNLIGINGDKSWIAHHRAGPLSRGGDEYERLHLKNYLTWHAWAFLKSHAATRWIALIAKGLYYRLITQGRTLEAMRIGGEVDDTMEGSWHGNDTVWRCIADLSQIAIFSDTKGTIGPHPARKYLCIVDGVIAGEGEGPMQNTPRPTGVVIAGFNPVSVDHVMADLMGFDPGQLPSIVGPSRHFQYAQAALPPEMKSHTQIVRSQFQFNRSWRIRANKE